MLKKATSQGCASLSLLRRHYEHSPTSRHYPVDRLPTRTLRGSDSGSADELARMPSVAAPAPDGSTPFPPQFQLYLFSASRRSSSRFSRSESRVENRNKCKKNKADSEPNETARLPPSL